MSHLSPSEFVDLADGTLGSARAAHADTCDRCRARAAGMRDTLRMAAADDAVPEPSPLFWEHLSARVRQGIDTAPRRSAFDFSWRGVQPKSAWLAFAVVLIAAAIVIPGLRHAGTPADTPAPSLAAAAIGQEFELTLDPDDAEVWAVLTAAAEDLQIDDARDAGMSVQPAAIDRAVHRLSAAERNELGRLLQTELKRSIN